MDQDKTGSNILNLESYTAEGMMRRMGIDPRGYPEAPALRHYFNEMMNGFVASKVPEHEARAIVHDTGISNYRARLELVDAYMPDFFEVYGETDDFNINATRMAVIFDEKLMQIEPEEGATHYNGLDLGEMRIAADYLQQTLSFFDRSGDDFDLADEDSEPEALEFLLSAANDHPYALQKHTAAAYNPVARFMDALTPPLSDNDEGKQRPSMQAGSSFLIHVWMFENLEDFEYRFSKMKKGEARQMLDEIKLDAEKIIDTHTDIGRDIGEFIKEMEKKFQRQWSHHKRLENLPSPQ